MDKPSPERSAELITAAFVALYDYAIGDQRLSVPYPLVEMIAFVVRSGVPWTCSTAQTLLDHPNAAEQRAAALVVTYESVGAHRHDPLFTMTVHDLTRLAAIRCNTPLTLRRALALLTQ